MALTLVHKTFIEQQLKSVKNLGLMIREGIYDQIDKGDHTVHKDDVMTLLDAVNSLRVAVESILGDLSSDAKGVPAIPPPRP